MSLSDDLERIAVAAAEHAGPDERLAGVVAAEPGPGRRVYLAAFATGDGANGWLALDDEGRPIDRRDAVREAASIVVMCELAGEIAGGGDLEGLRARLRE